MNIQTKFQTCSHSSATSVYQTIQDLTSVKIISDKLCKALTTIGTVCVKHLNECFAEDDVRQMRKSSLEEMKIFLLRISQGKVSNNALDDCKVMEYVENNVDQGQDFVPLDNNEYNDQNKQQDSVTPLNIPQEEEIHEENINIENIPKVQEVTTTENPSSSPLQLKGSRSAEFIEIQSTSHTVIESVDNNKDEVVTSSPNIAITHDEHDSSKDTAEAGDEVSVDTVTKHAEEGERLQYIGGTGGGHRTASDITIVTVIAGVLFIVIRN